MSTLLIATLLATLPLSGLAQTTPYPCQASAEVREALARLPTEAAPGMTQEQFREQRNTELRALVKRFPDELFVHRRYLDLVRDAAFKERDAVIQQYKEALSRRPDDPRAMYLYALSLVGSRTNDAIAHAQKAMEKAPAFALPHLLLADIYRYPSFKDLGKLQSHLEAFLNACPSALEGYRNLRGIENVQFLRDKAPKMRALLQGRTDTEAFRSYPALWSIEFRLKAPPEHEALRKQVAEDVKKLRALNIGKNRDWLYALEDGYKLAADAENERWAREEMERQFPRSIGGSSDARDQWRKAHPYPKPSDPEEKRTEYYRALLKATDDWMKRWPQDLFVWLDRMYAVRALDDVPTAEVQATADGFAKAVEKQGDRLRTSPPLWVQLAGFYLKKNFRVEQVPELVQKGLDDAKRERARDSQSDLFKNPEMDAMRERSRLGAEWQCGTVMLDAYVKLKLAAKAREALGQLETLLEKLKPQKPDDAMASRSYPGYQVGYWERAAKLAELENRKLDALTCYQNALRLRPKREGAEPAKDELAENTRRLWKELGGTSEGWQAWLTVRDAAAPTSPSGPMWTKMEKPLPAFELSDLGGKTWGLVNIRGKVNFVNLWATWCGPCREELPHFQKLYEKYKGRGDVQVFTINVDDNIGLVEPFMKQNKYIFPVLLGKSYIDGLLPMLSIPRNWIVDEKGVLRQEQIGFGQNDKWLDQVSEAIEKSRPSGS